MKLKYPVFAALIAAMVWSGCQTEQPEQGKANAPKEEVYQVHFVAKEIATRTVFGEPESSDGGMEYPTLWSGNEDKIAVSLNLSGFKGAAVSASQDGKEAEFDADFSTSSAEAPFTFYALSPHSACVGASSSNGGFHFNIPSEQTPLASSCDEAAQILVASESVESTDQFGSIDLKFAHVTAYGKLTLKGLGLEDDETIQSIDLTASVPFGGRFYYNFEQNVISEGEASRTISILPENLTFSDGAIADIWFACAPANLGGGSITVVVNTSAGKWTRNVSIPQGKLAFNAGRISKFAVNMADASFERVADRWVLVTNASQLKAGDEIIIADSATAGFADAISTTQNTDYRGYSSVSIAKVGSDFVINNPGNNVERFIIVAGSGTYSSCFRLKDATDSTDGYLAATNSGNDNFLKTVTTSTDYSNWKITISNNVAVISTFGTVRKSNSYYYRHIRFNSDRFATYRSSSQTSWDSSTGGTKATYIYRKEAGINIEDDPILEYDQYGAYVEGGNHVFGAGCQLSREYDGNGKLTFAVINPLSFEVAEFIGIPTDPAKGDSFTLSYSLSSGKNHTDTDYSVTVVKVDGPKVWLSAGAGNGFIVKK